MLRDVYGEALPLRAHIEAQILGRVGRLPGLPSSRLGLESLSGALDEFGFEAYLGPGGALPALSGHDAGEGGCVGLGLGGMHAAMEARLHLSGAQPQARAII
jgi:proteasome maturation protein